jgi:hypothetical protein
MQMHLRKHGETMATEDRSVEEALRHWKRVEKEAPEELVRAFAGSFCPGFLVFCFAVAAYTGAAIGWFEVEGRRATAQGVSIGAVAWAALVVKCSWDEEQRQKKRIRAALELINEAEKAKNAAKNQTELTSVDVEV